jgi:hypothetical protein
VFSPMILVNNIKPSKPNRMTKLATSLQQLRIESLGPKIMRKSGPELHSLFDWIGNNKNLLLAQNQ